MRSKILYIHIITVCYIILHAQTIFPVEQGENKNNFNTHPISSKPEDDQFNYENVEKIPPYERHKLLMLIGYTGDKCATPKCKALRGHYYNAFIDTLRWVDNTPFLNENKELIRLLINVHNNASLSFHELYDFPIGIPLSGEGKTLLLHSKSKENDPYINAEWSTKYGRKVWIIDREMEPGETKINGEKVYIFSTKIENTEKNSPLRKEDILAKNIVPLFGLLIDRNRCSEIRERFEYTFLSWNILSMKEHVSSTSSFVTPCFKSHLLGVRAGGILIHPEKCNSIEKFQALLEQMKNNLSSCQLEYEYIIGKVWYFFLDYGYDYSGLNLWPYYSDSVLMKMDPSGEINNALDGFRFLTYLIPEADRTDEMWSEVRKIGVWEKIKTKTTELILAKKLTLRKSLFEGEPTKLDYLAKEILERIEKERIEKERIEKEKLKHKKHPAQK